jgi:hypothetical protein
MWFSLGADYLTLGGKATKLHGGLIQAGAGGKTPAHPQAMSQAMFVDLSWFTGKAPLDGQSDKNHGTLHFYWKTAGWDYVNSSRLGADSELVVQIRSALKIVRAPGRVALSKNMGNGNGTAWISSIENQPPTIENDHAQRRSETKIQTENYQSALTWGGSDE